MRERRYALAYASHFTFYVSRFTTLLVVAAESAVAFVACHLAQFGHGLLDVFGRFALLQPSHAFIELGRQVFAGFFSHLAHETSKRARIVLVDVAQHIVAEVVVAAVAARLR